MVVEGAFGARSVPGVAFGLAVCAVPARPSRRWFLFQTRLIRAVAFYRIPMAVRPLRLHERLILQNRLFALGTGVRGETRAGRRGWWLGRCVSE